MNQSDMNLLDLPNEILLIILKKLDNIDVLYSLFGINNKRLDSLVQDGIFTNILNFVRTSLITDVTIDRFCTYILPRSHHCIKKLILETTSMKRILLAGDYPNLTYLELFNFNQEEVFRYFIDDSPFRHVFKHQIRDLILHNNDEYVIETALETYNTHVYVRILDLFKNLKHLTIVPFSVEKYPPLSIHCLPSTSYFSSALTVLCINVFTIDDCLSILDGRLKQLTTFIVQIDSIYKSSLIVLNMDELHNLKYFSLTSYNHTYNYDNLVVPLLRRMKHLEKLTLYLRVRNRSPFVDGTHLHNEILVHMLHLHTFIFYISTENNINGSVHRISNDVIQQTFTHIRYPQVACNVNYLNTFKAICHVFSLPFTFTCLKMIGNQFSAIVFDYVTYLHVLDVVPLQHEFFIRIGRAFPVLKIFSLKNIMKQSFDVNEWTYDNHSRFSVIEYSHLTSLDIMHADKDYIAQFLLETKAYLPRLTELKVNYDQLKIVTMNFTRDATRYNCSKVKRLLVKDSTAFLEDVYRYFPSL